MEVELQCGGLAAPGMFQPAMRVWIMVVLELGGPAPVSFTFGINANWGNR